MEKLWTDEVIIETVWKTFMSKLLGEWEDVILWVRLNSNVAVFHTHMTCTIQVHRDAYSKRGISRHSRRNPIQPQRE